MLGCLNLCLDAILFLVNHGANFEKRNIFGSSVLHGAAFRGASDVFSLFLQLGIDPCLLQTGGISAVHLAMSKRALAPLILNQDFKVDDISPIPWSTILGFGFLPLMFHGQFQLYQRKFTAQRLLEISNLHPEKGWSPLCLMALREYTQAMDHILDLGAIIDYEGSPEGSALMLACTAGATPSVKLLVRRGASLCYETSGRQRRSALVAAAASSPLTHWLLVERFTDQPKICSSGATEGQEEDFKPWSGGAQADFLITGKDERNPSESSFDYYKRLMRIRHDMRGKVVPPAGRGKTRRPSRLTEIVETVRRHPEDMRSPRE